ncbi:MAG: DUF2628 domain-containing protein [Rhodospirillales bacterium]|jgi:hypothetical protein|nr:DUF2628 domain-containing protein [Rhodospirillales bacterium]
MRVYSVHVRRDGLDPDRDIVLVKEGFSWAALVLSVVWALWHRLWMFAATIVIFMMGTALAFDFFGFHHDIIGVFHVGGAVLCGLIANDLRCAQLERQGFEAIDLVTAETRLQAESRFFDRHPVLAASFTEGFASS